MRFNVLFTLIFGGVFGLVGLIFLCIGLGLYIKRRRLRLNCYATADARVKQGGNGPALDYTVNGLRYERPLRGRGLRAYAVGQSMTLHYDPNDPGIAWVEGETTEERVIVVVFTGVGALFLLIGLITALILL
ncbi:MAG: DUF3592 domain-containing protein [Clostridia bacterium]|nr:DUF3592 domain-containing protein [Clostridia bacterium]